jgi:hypothetical protein
MLVKTILLGHYVHIHTIIRLTTGYGVDSSTHNYDIEDHAKYTLATHYEHNALTTQANTNCKLCHYQRHVH